MKKTSAHLPNMKMICLFALHPLKKPIRLYHIMIMCHEKAVVMMSAILFYAAAEVKVSRDVDITDQNDVFYRCHR